MGGVDRWIGELLSWLSFNISVAILVEFCSSIGSRGGLAARSGTEFTWSPQLRNSAEWDWVQILLDNKYGGECRHGRTMTFCSVLSFPAYKYQEKVSMIFLMDLLDIRRRDVWTVRGWLHLSWFGISASSVIFKLREFSSDHLAPSLTFFHLQWYYDFLPYLKHMLRA